MLKQFPITELIKQIQATIKAGTGKKCYDHVEKNQKAPFIYAEFINSRPANTKTMYCTDYNVSLHIVAEPNTSSVPIYKTIEELETALTVDISIPEPYNLIMQTSNGVQSIYTDEENKEKHAVLSYTFMICYGFMIK